MPYSLTICPCRSSVLTQFKELLQDPEMAVPVAAIKALTGVIERSQASTMMELEVQLRAAADQLKHINRKDLGGVQQSMFATAKGQQSFAFCSHDPLPESWTSISLSAGCEIFLRYVTRCFLDFPVCG